MGAVAVNDRAVELVSELTKHGREILMLTWKDTFCM
jgi:hypothetical protein